MLLYSYGLYYLNERKEIEQCTSMIQHLQEQSSI
nr:MAG TPA_asm: YrzO-like protein [Caudoviricetes sp.]